MGLTFFAGIVIIGGLIWTGYMKKIIDCFKNLPGVFVRDVVTTEEGATSVYTNAVVEAEQERAGAAEVCQDIADRRKRMESDILSIQEKLPLLTKDCENLMRAGKEEEALIPAMEYERLRVELATMQEALPSLAEEEKEAQDLLRATEYCIACLRSDRSRLIAAIKLSNSMVDASQEINRLRRNKVAERLGDTVREGGRASQKYSCGTVSMQETIMSAQIRQIAETANRINAREFLASLKKELPAAPAARAPSAAKSKKTQISGDAGSSSPAAPSKSGKRKAKE